MIEKNRLNTSRLAALLLALTLATSCFVGVTLAKYTTSVTGGDSAAPEVQYTFTVNPVITGDYDALDANENFKWTLKAPNAASATEYDTVAQLLAAVKALSGDASGTKVYEPGQLPTAFTAADEVYTIGWTWVFSTDADGDPPARQRYVCHRG